MRWYDPIQMAILIPLVIGVFTLLLCTCRIVRVQGKDRAERALKKAGGKAVYATWHQRMVFHLRILAGRYPVAVASQSRDAEYAVRVARFLGIRSIRGSSTRGGIGVLKAAIDKLRAGSALGLFADGPRGPARIAKVGAALMAQRGEAPILPLTWGADRCWVLNSWDRYLIPKPFARVAVCFAEPIWIPQRIKSQHLEPYRRLLEERLNDATAWCDSQFGLVRPWRKVKEGGAAEVGPL